MQVIGIADGWLVGFQGEVFVEYNLKIKEESPFPKLAVLELANGRMPGYLCTREAFKDGGYETGVSLVDPKTGDNFVETALRLLREAQAG